MKTYARTLVLIIALLLVPVALPASAARLDASLQISEPAPALGDSVTFTGTVPKSAKDPAVAIWCWQGTTQVWYSIVLLGQPQTIGGTPNQHGLDQWETGDATCRADLNVRGGRTLAHVDFQVTG